MKGFPACLNPWGPQLCIFRVGRVATVHKREEGMRLHKRSYKERETVLHPVASCKGCRHISAEKQSHGKLESGISFQHTKQQ